MQCDQGYVYQLDQSPNGLRPGEAENIAINERLRQEQDARLAEFKQGHQEGSALQGLMQQGMSVLRQARAALAQQAGGGSIQINGEEMADQTPGPNAAMAQGALDDLDKIEPLVRRGLLGAADVQAVVKSASLGDIAGQRDSRKAQLDMQAIVNQNANGTFNEKQTVEAMASLKRAYGVTTLLKVPGYAKLVGVEDQLKAHQDEAIEAHAKEIDFDKRFVRWDDKTFRPVLDQDAIVGENVKHELTRRKIGNMEAGARVISNQLELVAGVINQAQKSGRPISPDLQKQYDTLSGQLFGAYKAMGAEVGNGEPTQTLNPTPPGVGQNINAMLSAPSSPVSAASTSKAFNSRDEVAVAVASGKLSPNETFTLQGVRVRLIGNQVKRAN